MKLVRRIALAAAVASAAPLAFAQDAPKEPPPPPAPPAPAEGEKPAAPKEGDKPAAPAKKERTVDPKAAEAVEKYRGMVHSPRSLGAKALSAKGEITADSPMLGGEPITFNGAWAAEGGLSVKDFQLPEALTSQVPPEALEQIKSMVLGQLMLLFQPVFGTTGDGVAAFHMAYKPGDGGAAVVAMTAVSDTHLLGTLNYHMAADGLVQKVTYTLHLPDDNPMAATLASTEFEMALKHEKKGEKYLVTEIVNSNPFEGEAPVKIEHYEVTGGFLPKKVVISSMAQGDQTVNFFDYVIDGKTVDATKRAAAEKKPEPAPAVPAPVEPKKEEPPPSEPK